MYSSEIRCPALNSWDNYERDTNITRAGTTVNYTCAENYSLSNGEAFQIAKCNYQGVWNPEIAKCVCEYNFYALESLPQQILMAKHLLGFVRIAINRTAQQQHL